MSISQNPMTGQMKKSMANFSTYTLKGQNIIRSKAFNRKDANTEAQQAHRTGFRLIVDEYQLLGGLADTSFPNRLVTQTPYNAFVGINLPAAIDNTGETPVIDYSKMVVADGAYPGIIGIGATIQATGITVSFKSQISRRDTSESDKVIAFMRTNDGAVYENESVRGNTTTGEIIIECDGVQKEDVVYVYLFATSPDGKKVSRSVYVPIV
jgi:hypothetical protein